MGPDLLFLGFGFGNIAFVQQNFELVMVAIVGISVVPMAWEWFRHRAQQKKITTQTKSAEA